MPEIHLNRRGINSIEVPKEVEVTVGSDLVLNLINHGSPLHITLASTNSSAFTGFFHENLYVNGTEEFHIPIKEDAPPGFFTIQVVTGYGTRRQEFRVVVRGRPEPAPEPRVTPAQAAELAPSRGLHYSLSILILVIAAVVLYGLWVVYRADLLNAAAFVALLLGVILAWLRRRS